MSESSANDQGALLTEAIRSVTSGRDLSELEARAAADAIVDGRASDAQVAGLLVGLRMKGETADEVVGFARAMRGRAKGLPGLSEADRLVDTCGTGGDSSGTFNISTVAAFVAAGAGCRVAKHGNRGISSRCGSADVLEALGVPIDLSPEAVARSIESVGLGFMYAPRFHPAARHAAGARRAIGIRSVFNIVGPLTNPAGARRQVVGVFAPELTDLVAEALCRLGCRRALVVHGCDGLDELTVTGRTRVCEVREGAVSRYEVGPEDVELGMWAADELSGGDAVENARIVEEILGGGRGARRDVTVFNAGAVVYAAGVAGSLVEGVRMAEASIDSGAAAARLAGVRAAAGVGSGEVRS